MIDTIIVSIIKKYRERKKQRTEKQRIKTEEQRIKKLEQKMLVELQRQECEKGNHVYGKWVWDGIGRCCLYQYRHCKYCNCRQEDWRLRGD